jgi:hypothetical protein
MYISVPANQIRTVEAVLRDHNIIPSSNHLPVVAGTQLINIRDEEIAKNVIHRLKAAGISPVVTSTA